MPETSLVDPTEMGPRPARLVGTVDLPERIDRERYFRELSYLELSLLFAGPARPSVLAKWKAIAPPGSLGLVAPSVVTHRTPPPGARWPHDPAAGEFRDSAPSRAALAELRAAVDTLAARCVVFRSPPLFAASAANRDQLRWFFDELATAEAIGVERVWIPDGLWDLRTAVKLAGELGVTCAFDPLLREPGQPPELYYELELETLYLRISGLGRTGPIRGDRQDELVALLEHHETAPAILAFDSPQRWQDARALKRQIEAG